MQGLGFALFEQMVYDDNGQLLTGSFMDYAMPAFTQVPEIETILVEVPRRTVRSGRASSASRRSSPAPPPSPTR